MLTVWCRRTININVQPLEAGTAQHPFVRLSFADYALLLGSADLGLSGALGRAVLVARVLYRLMFSQEILI